MSSPSDQRADDATEQTSERPAGEPNIDKHPDVGQEQFERSGREDADLDQVGEGSEASDDSTPDAAPDGQPDPNESGPDVPAPLTHGNDDD
jgi:hypothetical protein